MWCSFLFICSSYLFPALLGSQEQLLMLLFFKITILFIFQCKFKSDFKSVPFSIILIGTSSLLTLSINVFFLLFSFHIFYYSHRTFFVSIRVSHVSRAQMCHVSFTILSTNANIKLMAEKHYNSKLDHGKFFKNYCALCRLFSRHQY